MGSLIRKIKKELRIFALSCFSFGSVRFGKEKKNMPMRANTHNMSSVYVQTIKTKARTKKTKKQIAIKNTTSNHLNFYTYISVKCIPI